MAGYPYYSPPPPPPSPPCNDTTPTIPPPPPQPSPPCNDTTPTIPPPPPPPACNHTTTPTLSPLKSPPPPAQSHYSHSQPSLPPASPPPPLSSYYSPPFSPSPPKSLRPPSSPQPSPPPYSSYPHYSAPPPSSPCNTTTPTLQTPPPLPACTCNKTTPTSQSPPPPSSYYSSPLASLSPPPPSTHYSPPLHSPPPPSHSPPPSPVCNETTPTLPPPPPPPPCNTTPPTFPSLSPPPPPSQHLPPPPPPSPYYSPPQPSLLPPPLSPPPPPPRSPPPPSPTPPPRLVSPPPPPPPSIVPPTYPPHKLPTPSPPPPSVPPPCHCVCPSPWAPPPNYPSIAPNYHPSIAPSPQFFSPSNGHHTVVLTTFVSLGGVFFLAFITIGLLSMAIKKRLPSMSTMGQSGTHEAGQGPARTFESIPTTSNYSVIDIPDQKPISQTLEESHDPNKRLPKRKPPSSVNDITEGKDQESIGDDSNKKLGKPLDDQNVRDNMDAPPDGDSEPIDDEEKLDERNRNTTEDVEQESNAAEDEPNDSKKRLRLRKKNNDRKGKHGERKSSKLVGQVMKVATNFDLDGEQEYQGDDNDDVQEVPQDAEDESNANEEKSDERNRKPVGNQSEAQDMEQESSAVEKESENSKGLRPQKRSPSSGLKGKKGEKRSSTLVGQALKAAVNVDLVGALQPLDYDNDEAEEEQSTQDMEQESNAVQKESENSKGLRPQKRSPSSGLKGKQGERKSSTLVGQAMKAAVNVDLVGALQPQDYDNDEAEEEQSTQDMEQESSAVEKESKNSKGMRPQKRSPSSGLKGKQGERKSSTLVGQAMKAAVNADLVGALQPQDYDSDEAEEEQSYRGRNELPNLGQNVTVISGDNPSKEFKSFVNPDDKEEESEAYSTNQDLHRHKRHTSTQGRKESSNLGKKFSATIGANQGVVLQSLNVDQILTVPVRDGDPGLADDNEKEENDDLVNECDDPNMEYELLVNDDAKEEKSDSFGSKKDSRLHKRQIGARGRTDPSNVGQIWSDQLGGDPSTYFQSLADDDEKEENDDPVNECDDPSMEGESFVDDNAKKEESKSFGSKKVSHLQKRQTGAQRRKEAPGVGQTLTAPIGGDVGVDLKSLADDYEKEENEEPSIECDDPNMEYELLVEDDAKEEKSDSFGSKKDSRLHKRQIGARERRDPRNVGQIWSDPLGGDPSTYFQSLADDDEKEENDDPVNECDDPSMEDESFVDGNAKKEESISFGSKKVSHLQKRQTGAQRRKETPDVGQTSTAPSGGDVGEDLKSLADAYEKEENEDPSIECDDPNIGYELLVDDVDAKEEKSDSFGSKKDSRLHKRQSSARGRRDLLIRQIWTDPLGGDPGTYFKSFADDDEKEEKEDQGMECDDPSMEFESLVDDNAKAEESESFGLKKVTRPQKSQIGGRGRKGPPNVSQILNIPTGSGAGVDLKFLAGDDENEEKKDTGKEWESLVNVDDKQKELELFGRKEVSRLHKRQTGAGGRKQPPNLGQIWTATTGSDPGVGLNSGATQVWASNIGESMTVRNDDDPFGELESHDDDGEGDLSGTATNEGDQNADMEFHEEDPELESECLNKGLGLHKPHALSLGETEPSTDYQSVFVTGDDDPDESGKVARSGKPLSRPRTTGVGGKRRT